MKYVILLLCSALGSGIYAQAVQVKEEPIITTMMSRFVERNQANTAIVGWRVQILATTDRQRLENTQRNFQYKYPNIPIDWVHSKPYYKLQAGAFQRKLDALRLKYIVGRDYEGLYLVRDENINVRELLKVY